MYNHHGNKTLIIHDTFEGHENCEKGKRSMNSITYIGIYKGGVNPVKSIAVVKRVIFPSILYGAELWNDVYDTSKVELERTQRFLARRCQGLEKRLSFVCYNTMPRTS